MKIAVLASRQRSLVNFRGPLLEAMVARGHEVHAICPPEDDDSQAGDQLRRMRVQVHRVDLQRTGTSAIADLAALWQLFRLLRRLRPDATFSYTVKPVIYGLMAARFARVPRNFALITGLGYAFAKSDRIGWVRRLVLRLYAIALRNAELVFFQNPDDQELFVKLGLLGTDARSLVVNGSGIDLDKFDFRQPEAGAPRFLLIARLLKAKGVREYIEAAARVRRQVPGATFELVGWADASNPDAIDSADIERWSREDGISYLGALGDVRPALARCSIYVLPSYREGTPRTVLEAMATGRAIITTDAPGCRETVVNGANGLLVDVASVESLASAMLELAGDPARVAEMGRESRRMAERKYDVHVVNQVMLEAMALA